jgi:hypothetical protein
MRARWLTVLLAMSLAANLVELAVFGVGFVRRRVELQRFFGWVQRDAPHWNMRPLVNAYWPAWDSLGRVRTACSDELDSLSECEPVDSLQVAAAIDRLATIDKERVRIVFQSVRALRRPENESARTAKLRVWRGMTGLGGE